MEKKYLLELLVIILLVGCSNEKYYNEWVEKNGKYNYYNNSGEKLRNTNIILEGKTYYFDKNGNMLTGWNDFDYERRHFGSDGAMDIGWKEIDNEWYLFNEDGLMNKKWSTDGINWYFFGNDGIMQKSKWVDDDYYIDEKGIMMNNGWHKVDEKMYFFDKEGKVDRNRDFQKELQELKKEMEKEKQNKRKRSITYTDRYGSHTINFILPELPAKPMGYPSASYINSIDIKYTLSKSYGFTLGIDVLVICKGTKEPTAHYPHANFLVKNENLGISRFVCRSIDGNSSSFYGDTTFQCISDVLFLGGSILANVKEITTELELFSLS